MRNYVLNPCPGCDVALFQRKYYPDPEATVHEDDEYKKFVVDINYKRHYLDEASDVA